MNPLQKAAFRRKVYYLATILVLFTVSMFWRGIIPIPLSSTARASEARSGIQRGADRLNNASILNQARTLDLRELEQGESEVEGTFVRLALTGSRGFVVTYLWYSAMDKQKRNDFHEMEELIRIVTRLQPHFITPWIYQSWNISYNVSVEMQGSGDMYHYIARGIDLLAEGERRNNHIYEGRKIGSPDMRYWIGFYYQNKFGVSDTVEVLRCLFQLSCISPDERNPDALIDKRTGAVDLPKFREFCERYPHLVRRLRGEDLVGANSDEQTKKKVQEALKCPRPEDIVQFLRDNQVVPSRYTHAHQLADAERQFPSLPPKFNGGEKEANTDSSEAETNDDFSAYKAARAWYVYSLVPVPSNTLDSNDQPLPSGAPKPATHAGEVRAFEYDPFLYRVPRSPMLIIFRQSASRVQSSQAEMEQKEGWFDDEGWRIDDPLDQPSKWWFPDPDAPRGVDRPLNLVLGTRRKWSLEEWHDAALMWRKHGEENGLIVTAERIQRYEDANQGAPVFFPPEPTEEQMTNPKLRVKYEASTALFYYTQNRSVTNFPFFLASSEAEAKPETVIARKLLWQAEQARKLGRTARATQLYEEGLTKWKAVLAKDGKFHRPDRSDRTEEETYNYELAYLRLLVQDDVRVRAKANTIAHQLAYTLRLSALVLPFQPFPFEASLPSWSKGSTTFLGSTIMQAWASRFAVPDWKKEALEDIKWYVADSMSPFARPIGPEDGVTDPERLGTPWIRPDIKDNVRTSQGVQRKQQGSQTQQGGSPAPPGQP